MHFFFTTLWAICLISGNFKFGSAQSPCADGGSFRLLDLSSGSGLGRCTAYGTSCYDALDGDLATFWDSTMNVDGQIGYLFSSPIVLDSIRVIQRPKGSDVTQIEEIEIYYNRERINVPMQESGEAFLQLTPEPVTRPMFRVKINSARGEWNNAGLCEIQVMGCLA